MSIKLTPPTFIKIKQLEKSSHGYNVKVKVISVEKQIINTFNGKKITLVKAIVGDQTGKANALFKLQNPEILSEGSVIAIRNGKKNFIKGHISLEIDIFGRITAQNADIKINTQFDLSAKEYEQNKNTQGTKRNNKQKRQSSQKVKRKSSKARKEKKQSKQNKQPRQSKQKIENKQYINTKIADIQPGQENVYTIFRIVEVIERVQKKNGKSKTFLDCVVGDQTGISDAVFPDEPFIKIGNIVSLKNGYAKVVKQHIQLQKGRNGRIEQSKGSISEVNISNNISKKAYVEVQ